MDRWGADFTAIGELEFKVLKCLLGFWFVQLSGQWVPLKGENTAKGVSFFICVFLYLKSQHYFNHLVELPVVK